jgi:hypothetical protein
MITEKGPTAHQDYDSVENVIFVSFPNTKLDTQQQIREHFDRIVAFWEKNCGGKKVYYVVNYDNISISLKENEFYAQQMKRIIPCAVTVIRYGGTELQRTGARLANIRLHTPSNLYESRDEALKIVRELKSGTISIAPPPGAQPTAK